MTDGEGYELRIAVIDSGANAPHPHLPAVAGGIAFDLEGQTSADFVDRVGHGTAAAAAIYEKAPLAELWAVKVFDQELATTVANLVRAIDWSVEHGCGLINLSLGTPNAFREDELTPAVARAIDAGSVIVSADWHDGRQWYPGSMPGVVGVVMDSEQPREEVVQVESEGRTVLRASPYARPVPGVPVERNFNGISFAVANATGVVAASIHGSGTCRTAADALRLVSS